VKLLLLVLDGMPVRHVGLRATPELYRLAADGAWTPHGGRAVMTAATYPNHATFVTGALPATHGLLANLVPTDTGVVPAYLLGPAAPTLFDACRAAGLASACVVGDQHLIGAMVGDRADTCWPPDQLLPAGTPADRYGYADDRATAARLEAVLADPPDLVVAQLNGPDTAAHHHGPDEPAALDAYRETDRLLGRLRRALRPVWNELVWIVVSDHDAETLLPVAPVDLGGEAGRLGLRLTVIPEGNAALLTGPDLRRRQLLAAVDGVAGVGILAAGVGLAWTVPGRRFLAPGPELRGVHGSPRNRAQVAVVGGGHPALAAITRGLAARPVEAADWAPTAAALLGLSLPSAEGRPLTGRPVRP
jgi:arylsulfatase A-like enzyme